MPTFLRYAYAHAHARVRVDRWLRKRKRKEELKQDAPHQSQSIMPCPPLQILRRKPESRAPSRVFKDHELCFQENVSEDVDSHARTGLNTSETRSRALRKRCVVDIAARDEGIIPFNRKGDIR